MAMANENGSINEYLKAANRQWQCGVSSAVWRNINAGSINNGGVINNGENASANNANGIVMSMAISGINMSIMA